MVSLLIFPFTRSNNLVQTKQMALSKRSLIYQLGGFSHGFFPFTKHQNRHLEVMAGMTLWINLRATLRGEKLVTYWPQAKPRDFFLFLWSRLNFNRNHPKNWEINFYLQKKTSNRFKEHLGFCWFYLGGVILIHLGGLLPGLIESGRWQLYRFTWDFGNAWHLVMASKRLDWSTMDVELLWRWEWWNFVEWWCLWVLFHGYVVCFIGGVHVCRTSKCLDAVEHQNPIVANVQSLMRAHYCPCFSSSSIPTQSWS